MDPKEKELIEQFDNNNIQVFYGRPNQYAHTDFLLYDVLSLIEFCDLNDINSVFFDCQYAETAEEAIGELKNELERSYKNRVAGYVAGVYKLPHIDAAFYAPVWEKIAKALEIEIAQKNSEPSDSTPDGAITDICIWAFHQGIRLFTVVDLTDENGCQDKPNPKLLKQKYNNMLFEELSAKYKEAITESRRVEQQKQQVILDEIAEAVRLDPAVGSMVTVKARNDYADRICVTWQIERGHEWLTKKAVRAIVELDYANRNS